MERAHVLRAMMKTKTNANTVVLQVDISFPTSRLNQVLGPDTGNMSSTSSLSADSQRCVNIQGFGNHASMCCLSELKSHISYKMIWT